MSVQLYMDEHVNAAITDALRERGANVLTVQEDGREGAEDTDVIDRAAQLARVVFTQDADFLREAVRRQRASQSFFGVIYCHQLRLSIGRCIDQLELIAGASESREYANRIEYLPLR